MRETLLAEYIDNTNTKFEIERVLWEDANSRTTTIEFYDVKYRDLAHDMYLDRNQILVKKSSVCKRIATYL